MNKMKHSISQNKFGSFSLNSNVKNIQMHHKHNHLIDALTKANQEAKSKEDYHHKLTKILAELLEQHADVTPEEATVTSNEPTLDITTIYNKSDDVPTISRDSITMPKMRAVVELAVSRAKLNKIISTKKW